MTSGGWIKIYRNITDHWVFQNPLYLKIWIDILLMANHDEAKVPVKGQLIDVRRGQFWTSIRKLAVRWEMDKDTVSRLLSIYQSDGMIYVDARKGYGTLVTVVNYSVYQDVLDDKTDSEPDRKPDRKSDKGRIENRHKQEVKKNIRSKEKSGGLLPNDPDGFREV